MRLLITGDWHLRETIPENRIDDYTSVMFKKLENIFKIYNEYNCNFLIQPGDFFDTPKISYEFLTKVIKLIQKYKVNILTVFGQHDLFFHNLENKSNTPLGFLINNKESLYPGSITFLSKNPFTEDYVSFTGVSFDEKVEECKFSKGFNILVIHKLFKSFDDNEKMEGEDVTSFIKKYKYDLVIAGDNHKFFNQGIDFINTGSLLRSNISQISFIPKIGLFNTEFPNRIKFIEIPIELGTKVFNMEALEKKNSSFTTIKNVSKNLNDVMLSLNKEHKEREFVSVLKKKCRVTKVPIKVIKHIKKAVENVNCNNFA